MAALKLLSGLDAAFLFLETPQMPMHVGAVHLLEPPAGRQGRYVERLRAHVAERLPLTPVLRRRLAPMPLDLASPAWVDAEPDLRRHIVEVRLNAAERRAPGLAGLEACVARLHAVPLSRRHPLWKMHVIVGLPPGDDGGRRIALYTQLHHAAVDGQAAVALAGVLFTITPDAPPPPLRPSTRHKVFQLGAFELLRGAVSREAVQVAGLVRAVPSAVGTLAHAARDWLGRGGRPVRDALATAPRTPLNVTVGPGRAYATVSLPLGPLKAAGKLHGATVNDMVLWVVGAALRAHYAGRGVLSPRKSMVAAVPVSLRVKGDASANTQASMSLVSLATHLADPRRRLQHILRSSRAMKSAVDGLRSLLPTDFPSIGVPWLIEAATALYGRAGLAERLPVLANLVVSNVPGPAVPLYMAGARMHANYPTSIVVHGMALNITVQSYDGSLDFGLMADCAAMPDVCALADAMRAAMDGLPALQSGAARRAPGKAAKRARASAQTPRRASR